MILLQILLMIKLVGEKDGAKAMVNTELGEYKDLVVMDGLME